MWNKLRVEKQEPWVWLYAAFVFFSLVFYLLYQVNVYLSKTISDVYYQYAAAMVVAMYFSKRGLKDGIEIKLLTAFCAWLFLTRLINGNPWLDKERLIVLSSLSACVSMPLMMNLKAKNRLLFIDAFNIVLCTYTTAISVIGIYAVVKHAYIVNPITLGFVAIGTDGELALMDNNRNIGALWIFAGFWMLVYEFIKHKKLAVRIPLGLACAVNYIAIALLNSRNVKVATAFGFSLLAIQIVSQLLKNKKISQIASASWTPA